MNLKKICLWTALVFVNISDAFLLSNAKMSSYLDKINNISSQLLKRNIVVLPGPPKIEKGFTSAHKPIPKSTFDTIFLNIFRINKVYISSTLDRMIFETNTGDKYLHYIKDQDDYMLLNQLLKLISLKCKFVIISDVKNMMDDPYGSLYCEP